MKLFTTRSLIYIQTDANEILVQGIYWKKGYSNSKLHLGTNRVSKLTLEKSDKCNFSVFNFPLMVIVCIAIDGVSSVKEYTLLQDKTLVFTREYNTFQYTVSSEFLNMSFIDKVFFYQPAFKVDGNQRKINSALLIFDPKDITTNIFKKAIDICSKTYDIHINIESTYGSILMYVNIANS